MFLAYSVVGSSEVVKPIDLEMFQVSGVLRQDFLVQPETLPLPTPFVNNRIERFLAIGPQVGHCKVKLKNQYRNFSII